MELQLNCKLTNNEFNLSTISIWLTKTDIQIECQLLKCEKSFDTMALLYLLQTALIFSTGSRYWLIFDPWHICGLFFPVFGGVEDLKNAIMCCCSFDEHFWLQWWEQMHRCELWAVHSFQVNCNETLFKTIHSLNGIFWFACVFLFLLFSQFLNWKLSTYLQANQDKKGIRLSHRI